MEYVFTDVNEAIYVMWDRMMQQDGETVFARPSRNGPVHEARLPVTTVFTDPRRRVLFDPARDANPFFHLFEAIWMLAGRNEVKWLAQFNKQMMEYSDDGEIIEGSDYGLRWRQPLAHILLEMRKDPNTRRAFVPIFSPEDNVRNTRGTRDLPCNVGISFLRRGPQLDMTVFNRSNDMLLGAYGANYVHFGFLQEYVAQILQLRVGTFTQVSSCFHLYTDFPVAKRILNKGLSRTNLYDTIPTMQPGMPVLNTPVHDWQQDAKQFIDDFSKYQDKTWYWNDPWFSKVAVPMYRTWHAMIKERNYGEAQVCAFGIQAEDWARAAFDWIKRRQNERDSKTQTT